jgi:hypothetical protein
MPTKVIDAITGLPLEHGAGTQSTQKSVSNSQGGAHIVTRAAIDSGANTIDQGSSHADQVRQSFEARESASARS